MQNFLTILALLLALVGLISLGFAIQPRPYRMHPQPAHPGHPDALRPDLPEPVRKHFVETLGETPLTVQTAVVWGRGRISVRGVWTSMRFQAWYRPGVAFSRRMSITWFQRPILRGSEALINGQGAWSLAGKSASGPFIDQAMRLSLWAEAIWMPAFLVHDPSVVWEPVDDETARLTMTEDSTQDHLLAHFDPQTGRMTHLSGMRYSDIEEDGQFVKVPWRVDLLDWKEFRDGDSCVLLPFHIDMASGESGSPLSYWIVDGVAYNVDVGNQLG